MILLLEVLADWRDELQTKLNNAHHTLGSAEGGVMGSKPLSVNLREKRNRPPPDEPWVWVTRELMESDAWRTAPIWTMRFVFRLMTEHMIHAGTENGRLICTYDDCHKAGICKASIKAAQADAIKRGLVYRTTKGVASAGTAGRKPHRFGLGRIGGHDGSPAPNLWKRYSVGGYPTQDIISTPTHRVKLNGSKRTFPKSEQPIKPCPQGQLNPAHRGKLNGANPPSGVPGHPRCKIPTVPGTMPPGWHWCRDEQRLVTDRGVAVPIVDHPLVGTDEQRAALITYGQAAILLERE